MGRGNFTENEIDALRRNPYVADVNRTSISYSREFKFLFIKEYREGRNPVDIFRSAGFDIAVLGSKRIERACARWKEAYRSGTLGNRSAVLGKENEEDVEVMSSQERRKADEKDLMAQCRRQEKTIQLLQAEVEFFRRICKVKGVNSKDDLSSDVICQIISDIADQKAFPGCVSHLCDVTGISRSLYYRYRQKD